MGSEVYVIHHMVVQVLLYGVEVWGDTIPLSVWSKLKKTKKLFLCKQLGSKIIHFLYCHAIRKRFSTIEVLMCKDYTTNFGICLNIQVWNMGSILNKLIREKNSHLVGYVSL